MFLINLPDQKKHPFGGRDLNERQVLCHTNQTIQLGKLWQENVLPVTVKIHYHTHDIPKSSQKPPTVQTRLINFTKK